MNGRAIEAMLTWSAVFTFGMAVISSCATPRTKLTDKSMRVMVDPVSIDGDQYVRIVKALVESGKWTVVDRGFGFHAVKQEQERLHRSETDRYADKEKWAQWSKLYGVGAIVVANAQCQVRETWIFPAMYYYCEQFLTLVDSNTAEVVAAIESSESGPSGNSQGAVRSVGIPPSWDGAVEKLIAAYPKYFDEPEYHERVKRYQEESRQLAQEQKDGLTKTNPNR